jgi:uncharacterized protein
MANHPLVEILVTLARADLSIVHAKSQHKAMGDRKTAQQAALTKAKAELKGHRETLASLLSRERKSNRDLESYQRRKKTATTALESGMGGADAAERQISQCTDIIDQLELDVLENLEEQDAAKIQIKASEDLEKTLTVKIESQTKADKVEIVEIRRIATEKGKERAEVISGLDTDTVRRYEQLRRAKGTAVARVVDNCCRPCQVSLPMQNISDLLRGRIVFCLKCGRWLFNAEE